MVDVYRALQVACLFYIYSVLKVTFFMSPVSAEQRSTHVLRISRDYITTLQCQNPRSLFTACSAWKFLFREIVCVCEYSCYRQRYVVCACFFSYIATAY